MNFDLKRLTQSGLHALSQADLRARITYWTNAGQPTGASSCQEAVDRNATLFDEGKLQYPIVDTLQVVVAGISVRVQDRKRVSSPIMQF
jgi:hypothetical protein